MNIADYLKETGTSQQAFADLVGVTQSRVSQWIGGDPVPPDRWLRIEEVTCGKVTMRDLRPDVFGPAPQPAAKRRQPKKAA